MYFNLGPREKPCLVQLVMFNQLNLVTGEQRKSTKVSVCFLHKINNELVILYNLWVKHLIYAVKTFSLQPAYSYLRNNHVYYKWKIHQ